MSSGKVHPIKEAADPFAKGLPANLDAERFVLGSILLDDSKFPEIADVIRRDDFALEKHRRIFGRMMELNERGERIDRVTVANELLRYNELESVDGLSYLVSLDDGLPHVANVDSYLKILRQKSALRRMAISGQRLMDRALMAEEEPAAILESLSAEVETLGAGLDVRKTGAIDDLPPVGADMEAVRYLRNPELPEGSVIALTGDSGSGKSTLATAWARDVIEDGRPALILDRENPQSVVLERMQRLGLENGPLLRWAGGWIDQVLRPDSPAVIAWVRACDLKPLIVIDSLIAFLGGDENDAGEMRRFMHQARRLADLGATVVVIHHDGKAESSRDFRGSSDFKAAVDQAFHVSNVGSNMLLDRIRLRCFKSRFAFTGEIIYRHADGRFVRDETPHAPAKIAADVLRSLLRMNPGITGADFEKRALAKGIARSTARDFLDEGVLERFIQRTSGNHNAKKYEWVGGEIEGENDEI